MSDLNHNEQDRLCVKELAAALQVGTTFVYQMRACGFQMNGRFRHEQTATVQEAIQWVRDNDFRLVNGRGVTKGDNSKG